MDHFNDALGAMLAKDIIRSKPKPEALELEALELRVISIREKVVNKVSTHQGEANQMQNLPLPGWDPELSTMIASATTKAAAEAVVDAIPLSGVQGNRPRTPVQTSQWLGQGMLVMWVYTSFPTELSPGKPRDQVPVIRISSVQLHL